MNKKSISKILTKGSPKKRATLLGEHIARRQFGEEPLLTDAEFNRLNDSFTKADEIRVYNKFRVASEKVLQALINIQGVMFNVKTNYSNLRGYILVWNTIENAELLVNSVLHEVKDPEERKRIAEGGAKGIDMLFSKTAPDKEGYIEIKIDFEKDSYKDENGKILDYGEKPKKTRELSLLYAIQNVKKEAEDSAIKFLSWREAILDYMEEQGFNIKSYKDRLEAFTEEIHRPIIGWEKYESSADRFIRSHPQTRLDKLKEKYNTTPITEKLPVDKQIYNEFKREFLDG